MNLKRFSLPIRTLIALVVGFWLVKLLTSGVLQRGSLSGTDAWFKVVVAIVCGGVLFALVGLPLLRSFGEKASLFYMPSDSTSRIMPEYSVAEARVATGNYEEAVDEYRKVIAAHPDDIYPHWRIAELAVNHLNDVELAERELRTAIGKAKGVDTTALAAGRLADFYQFTLQDPARALKAMKQLRRRIPGTKQCELAEERIAVLKGIVHGTIRPPQVPDKIAPRPSRYQMPE